MKALLFITLHLIFTGSIITESDGLRGFINNVQVADGSSISFPNFNKPSPEKEIPLDMLLRLHAVEDIKDFIENFIYTEGDNVTLTEISSQIGHEAVQRSTSISRGKMAVCTPELRTVSLRPEKGTNLYYHPSCIRVERCGGCCAHNLLSCTATESEILNIEVLVAEYKGGHRLMFREYTVVPVERHTKCKCNCKIQPEDCTESQVYNPGNCNCECSNLNAQRKCYAEGKTKIWSKSQCACLCREILECPTGFIYDRISCKCESESRIRPSQKRWPNDGLPIGFEKN